MVINNCIYNDNTNDNISMVMTVYGASFSDEKASNPPSLVTLCYTHPPFLRKAVLISQGSILWGFSNSYDFIK